MKINWVSLPPSFSASSSQGVREGGSPLRPGADGTLKRRDGGLPGAFHRLRSEESSPWSDRSEKLRSGYLR